MTQETLEKAYRIYDQIRFLKEPEMYGMQSQITHEFIGNITKIDLTANGKTISFKDNSNEFIQLKLFFIDEVVDRINKIAELEKQLSEL